MGHSKNSLEREIHSITGLSQKQEKVQINNLTTYLKELKMNNKQSPMRVEGWKLFRSEQK